MVYLEIRKREEVWREKFEIEEQDRGRNGGIFAGCV